MNNNSSLKIVIAETSVIIRSGLTAVLKRIPNLNAHPIEVSSPESLQNYIHMHPADIIIINPTFGGWFDLPAFKAEHGKSGIKYIAMVCSVIDNNILKEYDENFAMCDVSTKFVVSCALQTIECDISRFNISFQSSICNFDWKGSCHDHLIFHLAEGKFAGSSISTMESHECIFQCIIEFSFDGFFVHILRYGVVDIKQCNDIVAYYLSDELT